jgi:hypothetical protein
VSGVAAASRIRAFEPSLSALRKGLGTTSNGVRLRRESRLSQGLHCKRSDGWPAARGARRIGPRFRLGHRGGKTLTIGYGALPRGDDGVDQLAAQALLARAPGHAGRRQGSVSI